MSQIIQESHCRNKTFYRCEVENQFCINCKSFFGKIGDEVQKVEHCIKCGKSSKLGGVVVHISDGKISTKCNKCVQISKSIDELVTLYVGEYVYFDDKGHVLRPIDYNAKKQELAEQIANKPKEEIIEFLVRIHGMIER